mmetsp:Transcript_37710/g.99767  ORF Transcript_37710/g.99767 Transcript_37710/m.99767 type:complete len:320 (+) Transcript_37710:311-1270(+)
MSPCRSAALAPYSISTKRYSPPRAAGRATASYVRSVAPMRAFCISWKRASASSRAPRLEKASMTSSYAPAPGPGRPSLLQLRWRSIRMSRASFPSGQNSSVFRIRSSMAGSASGAGGVPRPRRPANWLASRTGRPGKPGRPERRPGETSSASTIKSSGAVPAPAPSAESSRGSCPTNLVSISSSSGVSCLGFNGFPSSSARRARSSPRAMAAWICANRSFAITSSSGVSSLPAVSAFSADAAPAGASPSSARMTTRKGARMATRAGASLPAVGKAKAIRAAAMLTAAAASPTKAGPVQRPLAREPRGSMLRRALGPVGA